MLTLRSTATNTGKTTGTTLVFPSASVVSGDLIVVLFSARQSSGAVATIADNLAQTWAAVATPKSNGVRMQAWWAISTQTGSMVATITFPSNNKARAGVLGVFHGPMTSGLYTAPAFANDNSSPFTVTLGAAHKPGDLAIGLFALRGPGSDSLSVASPQELVAKTGTTGGGDSENATAVMTWGQATDSATSIIPSVTDSTHSRNSVVGGVVWAAVHDTGHAYASGVAAQLRRAKKTIATGPRNVTVNPGGTVSTSTARLGEQFQYWGAGSWPRVPSGSSGTFNFWIADLMPVFEFKAGDPLQSFEDLEAEAGAVEVAGNTATTLRNLVLHAQAGAVEVTGNPASTPIVSVTEAESGEVLVDGIDVATTIARVAVAQAAGAATASGVSAIVLGVVGQSVGVATVGGVGNPTVSAVGAAAGEAIVDGVGARAVTEIEVDAESEGAADVEGVAAIVLPAIGVVAGLSTVSGQAAAATVVEATGVVSGQAQVSGQSQAVVQATAASSGLAIVSGLALAVTVVETTASSTGLAQVSGLAFAVIVMETVGEAVGQADVFGVGVRVRNVRIRVRPDSDGTSTSGSSGAGVGSGRGRGGRITQEQGDDDGIGGGRAQDGRITQGRVADGALVLA